MVAADSRLGERAPKAHWEDTWRAAAARAPEAAIGEGIWHHPAREIDAFFAKHVAHAFASSSSASGSAPRLLEIGCARSVWLPHFAKAYGFRVSGLDYSALGCEQAREGLKLAGVDGTIVHADFLSPPAEMLGAFDVVTSFGVLEHFEDTAGAVAAASRFLRPGGLLFTEVPNLAGVLGWLQKKVHPPVFDLHVVLDVERLTAAHHAAGLDVVAAEYLVPMQVGILNFAGLEPPMKRAALDRALFAAKIAAALVWKFEERVKKLPAGRSLSGYVGCVARKA